MTTYIAFTYTADVDWWAPGGEAEHGRVPPVRGGPRRPASRRRRAAPDQHGDAVRVEGARGGDVVTTDGPYAETKEALTGYYLIEADDLDEAIAIAAEIPAAWDGAVEVRPVIANRLTAVAMNANDRSPRRSGSRGRASSRP